MIKGSRLLLSLLLSMVIPMATQAQTNHLQETLQAQKEKLEQLHMDAREHVNESPGIGPVRRFPFPGTDDYG